MVNRERLRKYAACCRLYKKQLENTKRVHFQTHTHALKFIGKHFFGEIAQKIIETYIVLLFLCVEKQ